MSKIEWTERTWNPIVGCSVVSPGCTNCYAMRMAARLERMGVPQYAGLTKPSKAGPVWTGETRLVEGALTLSLRTRKPTTWFVNSMSDLFHESVPDTWIDQVFAVAELSAEHTYQILTKRSARMQRYMADPATFGRVIAAAHAIKDGTKLGDTSAFNWPLPNVWLGVSAEDQRRADERVPDLLNTPAAVRFVSAEPLLGPIRFDRICILPQVPGSLRAGIHVNALAGRYVESGMPYVGDWDVSAPYPPVAAARHLDGMFVGGESGPKARPMRPHWARSIRDQCAEARVPFLFKQWGNWGVDPTQSHPRGDWISAGTATATSCADAVYMAPIGKKAAGRLLDGVEHNGMPEIRHGR